VRSIAARGARARISPRRSSSSSPQVRHPAERRAARWYLLHGYRILDRNRWIAGYELDLVARRGRTVVFCEVKSKRGEGFGDPLEMVTAEKARRIRRAAESWLAARRDLDGLFVRFDVLAERSGRLEHLPDAF
jgi:putative endonuclease